MNAQEWDVAYKAVLRKEPLWLEVLKVEPARPGIACGACGRPSINIVFCRLGWYEPTTDYTTARCAMHPVKPIPYMVFEARTREGEDPINGTFMQSVIDERYAALGQEGYSNDSL